MAQIESGGGNGKGKNHQKKMTIRVDFTPMVDMNMLLITFFMLCTTMIKTQTLNIALPSNKENLNTEQMNQASIEMLKGRKHVGMINACLRLKKTANGSIHFTVESEEEIGTTITTTLEEVQRDAGKRDIAESTAG